MVVCGEGPEEAPAWWRHMPCVPLKGDRIILPDGMRCKVDEGNQEWQLSAKKQIPAEWAVIIYLHPIEGAPQCTDKN